MGNTTVNTDELPQLLKEPVRYQIEGIEHVALPPNWRLEALDKLLPEPKRIRANIIAHDVRGFIDYLNEHKFEKTMIYAASPTSPGLLARIDDNAPGLPSHITHTAKYGCPLTHEWQQWTGSNDRPLSQVDFAEFIENNIGDITVPSGTELLNACLTFRDTGSVEFNSAIRLADGRVQFKYVEKDENKELKFPENITIAIPVFEGMNSRFELKAKLRYRIDKEKGLSLRYQLERKDLVIKAAYEQLMVHVSDATELTIFRAI